jgi:hypothetical protein
VEKSIIHAHKNSRKAPATFVVNNGNLLSSISKDVEKHPVTGVAAYGKQSYTHSTDVEIPAAGKQSEISRRTWKPSPHD